MRGRKPLPTSLKRLTGDGIHDTGGRIIPMDAQAIPGAPEIPSELTGDALLAWHDFLNDMTGMNTITHADRASLVSLCQAWAEMQYAQKQVDTEGPVVVAINGARGANPYCRTRNEARIIVLRLLNEFGLTPVARVKLKTLPTEEEDEFTELRDVG